MELRHKIADTQLRLMRFVHGTMLAASGGKMWTTVGDMPVYKVTTTGRVSGQPRAVLLTAPVRDGDRYVFVASKGGDDRDPDWYRNLLANPAFTVEPADGGAPVTLVARTASPDEKAELWPRIVAAYRGYEGYQRRTDREIPVVIAVPSDH